MGQNIAGSILSVSIKNRLFAVKADVDAVRNLGGFENEMQPNGDGTVTVVQTRVPWSLGSLTIEINDTRRDQEFLNDVKNSGELVPINIKLASKLVYQAKGNLTGALEVNTKSQSAEISLGGPGEQEQQ